jgi:predicted dehydrogenase
MMNDVIRLAIVGCGAVVRHYHLPALAGLESITVSALCDLNPQHAERLRNQFRLGAEVTDKLDTLAGRADAALVAVTPRHHAAVSIRLLEMGIDVCCEKPLASSSAEAERMIEAATRNQRQLTVAQWCRFLPNLPLLRRLVLDGFIGDVEEITAEFGGPLDWPMESAAYFSRQSTAGGVLFDTGIHMVDAIVWLFGDLSDIEYADDSYGGVEANAELRASVVMNRRKVPVRFSFSWTDLKRNGLRVRGKDGSAIASPAAADLVTVRKMAAGQPVVMDIYRAGWTPGRPPTDPFRDQLVDFVAAVTERREPFVTARSAIRALRVIETAYSVRRQLSQPWLSLDPVR